MSEVHIPLRTGRILAECFHVIGNRKFYNIKKVPPIRNFFISWKWDLNPRPTHYECVALPTELIQHIFFFQPTKLLYIISFYLASVFFIKMIYDDIAPVFQIHVQKTRAIFSHIVSVQSQAKFHKTDVKCLHFEDCF